MNEQHKNYANYVFGKLDNLENKESSNFLSAVEDYLTRHIELLDIFIDYSKLELFIFAKKYYSICSLRDWKALDGYKSQSQVYQYDKKTNFTLETSYKNSHHEKVQLTFGNLSLISFGDEDTERLSSIYKKLLSTL